MTNADEVLARILKLSAERNQHWTRVRWDGRAAALEAAKCTVELDQLWHRYRAARATQTSPDLKPPTTAEPAESIDRFICERCQFDADATATVAEITAAYAAWAEAHNQPEVSPKRLTRELNARGVASERNYAGRYYRGVGMTHPSPTS